MTSIGFGGGDVIEVALPLSDVRELLTNALNTGEMLELTEPDGATVVINPQQVKVLQNSGAPETFPLKSEASAAAQQG